MIVTIGLEVHAQLRTRSKMFCACPVEFGAPPNSHTCPVCLGLPGALPVMNAEALRLTALAGLMLDCELADVSHFDRKNYFYPDMAKNYQITQSARPICAKGRITLHDLAYPKDAQKKIATAGKEIALTRIHLEEDVARSFHLENGTGLDFNRAGTPLLEIVSEPEISAPEEAFAFLTALRQVLLYGGVSQADMEKGQLRCDCNVSVRPEGQSEFGVKIEIKNMNSISGVRRALAYEIRRQTDALGRGEALEQETRGWDDNAGETFLMRTKESVDDYRYFPDPDLPAFQTESFVKTARKRIPELPPAKRARFVEQYGVSPYDAGVLANDLELATYFEAAATGAGKPKLVANWILNDLRSALANAGRSIAECPVAPAMLDELVNLIDSGMVSSRQAKDVFARMFLTGTNAATIVQEERIAQLSDNSVIETLCDQVIFANPKPVADFKGGNAASLNFLKGQVMKISKGTANPALLSEILEQKLAKPLTKETKAQERI